MVQLLPPWFPVPVQTPSSAESAALRSAGVGNAVPGCGLGARGAPGLDWAAAECTSARATMTQGAMAQAMDESFIGSPGRSPLSERNLAPRGDRVNPSPCDQIVATIPPGNTRDPRRM